MKIALFGYGKMGKEIEKLALQRGHEIILKIEAETSYTELDLKNADVAIEFSRPESAVANIMKCFSAQVPVVVGTTGWYEHYKEVCTECGKRDAALLTATNFSIGVNLFFKLNSYLAQLMKTYADYQLQIEETHHTQKLDAPSGTAITLAEGILRENHSYSNWEKENSTSEKTFAVISHRVENVPGTHSIKYKSEIDDIEITHIAHNRKGFALGAIVSAEFLQGKKGVFNMQDVLNTK